MRTLVIDGDRSGVAELRARLEIEGFAVEVAYDGVEGLQRAREGSYDIIVLAVIAPRLDGYAGCVALRSEQIWTPILMVNDSDDEHDECTVLDAGADGYLSKPFSYPVLVARMRALLRRAPLLRDDALQPRARILALGDLQLDPAAKRTWRGDTEVCLTAREVAVLELLLRRRAHVVPKHEILDEVWGNDYDGDANIVEVYIGRLRAKLDQPFDRETIHTYRGTGYRLVDRRIDRATATQQDSLTPADIPRGRSPFIGRRAPAESGAGHVLFHRPSRQ